MRNEALVGYLLHQRSYQEKRAIYYLFLSSMASYMVLAKKARRYLHHYSCLLPVSVILKPLPKLPSVSSIAY